MSHLLASYFREFTAMEYSNPERAASSIDGSTTEEKVSFINNALRHVIFGVELFLKKHLTFVWV
jgi:hypothetical protein